MTVEVAIVTFSRTRHIVEWSCSLLPVNVVIPFFIFSNSSCFKLGRFRNFPFLFIVQNALATAEGAQLKMEAQVEVTVIVVVVVVVVDVLLVVAPCSMLGFGVVVADSLPPLEHNAAGSQYKDSFKIVVVNSQTFHARENFTLTINL
jgi:hypothetical protein